MNQPSLNSAIQHSVRYYISSGYWPIDTIAIRQWVSTSHINGTDGHHKQQALPPLFRNLSVVMASSQTTTATPLLSQPHNTGTERTFVVPSSTDKYDSPWRPQQCTRRPHKRQQLHHRTSHHADNMVTSSSHGNQDENHNRQHLRTSRQQGRTFQQNTFKMQHPGRLSYQEISHTPELFLVCNKSQCSTLLLSHISR